jgi:hypothetical protein
MAVLSDTHGVFFQHTITIEPYAGQGGGGQALYGASFTVLGFLDSKRKTTRTQMTETNTGDEVVSEATFYCDPGPDVPNESRVTLPDGRVSRVLAVGDRSGGTTDLPSHLEIVIA